MPSWQRASGVSPTMSRPSSRMRPEVGASWPAIWWTRLVLPAPFGPISAWRSPFLTDRLTLRVTTRLPNALLRPSIARTLIARTSCEALPQPAPHALAQEHHADDEDDADPEQPVLGVRADDVLQQQEHRGADRGADDRAGTAEDHHDDRVAGQRPVQDVARHERVLQRVEAAADARDRARHRERDQLEALHRVAGRAHPLLVLADADEDRPERRRDQSTQEPQHEHEAGRHDVELHVALVERQAEQRRPSKARQPVGAAGHAAPLDRDRHQQLRESHRQHEERDAADADREEADRRREQRRRRRCRRRSRSSRTGRGARRG